MSLVPFQRTTVSRPVNTGFEDFDRIFDNFFKNAISNASMTNVSTPSSSLGDLAVRMDISETDKAYHIKADLPGVDEKEIELKLNDGVLTVSGVKHAESREEGKNFHRVERSYGSFTRSLQLPAEVKEDKISATMKNGVLEIVIPKAEEQKKKERRIDIKSH